MKPKTKIESLKELAYRAVREANRSILLEDADPDHAIRRGVEWVIEEYNLLGGDIDSLYAMIKITPDPSHGNLYKVQA